MNKRKKPEYPEKTLDDELQKVPHIRAGKFKPQLRLKPALQHWWQARNVDVLITTPSIHDQITKVRFPPFNIDCTK